MEMDVKKVVIISRPLEPFIPEFITIHLGLPYQTAENVTVQFPSYIKNVASRVINPIWPESAIRANIHAIVSFALNKVFTEYYRSRGYDFDITNSSFDQPYDPEANIYENISKIVDEIFNSYVAEKGSIEPVFTQYCDGQIKKCTGLNQMEAVRLALEGYTPLQILQHFYGSNIDIIENVPVGTNFESYPLYPLELGSFGRDVSIIQHELNRISENYPSIPKIAQDSDGIFGAQTEAAVKEFQRVFALNPDGIIDNATWYKIKYIYSSVKGLGTRFSEGLPPEEIESPFDVAWEEGDSGIWVKLIQYYVRVLGCYYSPEIPIIEITGYFGPETRDAIMAIERKFNIIVDGIVGIQTFALLDKQYKTILNYIPEGCLVNKTLYPGYMLSKGMGDKNVTLIQTYMRKIAETYPSIPKVTVTGIFDEQTEAAVRAIQQQFLGENTGLIGPITWSKISELYENLPTTPSL
ncbi:MAG: peptidoglycan-binding protein [Bacillota bacterium]